MLATIVIVYSVGLIQRLEFADLRKVRTLEFRWALAAFLGVLVFGTLQGIVIAILLSFLGLAAQVSRPRVLVLDLSRVFDIEYSALRAMSEGLTRLREDGVEVWLAGLSPDVLRHVRASGLAEEVGEARMFRDAREALHRFLANDDPVASPRQNTGAEA